MNRHDNEWTEARVESSPRGNLRPLATFSALLVAALFVAGGWSYLRQNDGVSVAAPPRDVTPRGALLTEERSTIQLFRDASRWSAVTVPYVSPEIFA